MGRYNININCISPGDVEPVFGHERSPESRQRLTEVTRWGECSDRRICTARSCSWYLPRPTS